MYLDDGEDVGVDRGVHPLLTIPGSKFEADIMFIDHYLHMAGSFDVHNVYDTAEVVHTLGCGGYQTR